MEQTEAGEKKKTKIGKIIFIATILVAIALSAVFSYSKLKKNPNLLRIGIASDIHRCSAVVPPEGNDTLLKKFIESVNKKKVDFNVALGDLASYRVNDCSNSAAFDIENILDNLKKTKSPTYNVLGDHDIADKKTLDYWLEKTELPRTFYSFDVKNFHILVLDTITGGIRTTGECEEESPCKEYQEKYRELRTILEDTQKKIAYLRDNKTTEEKLFKEKENYKRIYLVQDKIVKASHSTDKWDKGSLGDDQLSWIRNELQNTDKENVILFSDHPLVKFQGERKEYNIENLDKLTLILKNSGKKIVSIAGEAHTWHEENIDGIQYYIVDQLQTANGSWAIFEWTKDGPKINKITH